MLHEESDLHGSAPDRSKVALILIDVINDLEFADGEKLRRQALPMAANLAKLKKRLKKAGVPAIYVNDNFGRWQSNLHTLLEHCLHDGVRGRDLVSQLQPEDDDYFVLKPKHSAFFSTTLDTLLRYLGTRRLILTGVATDICVLFTANDAYMRDFEISVPEDCVAANTRKNHDWAMLQMKSILKADIRPSNQIRPSRLLR
jgi:nicotinamidase-related amidase